MFISRIAESSFFTKTNFFQPQPPSAPGLAGIDGSLTRTQKLKRDLPQAMANNHLYLEYQPQWDTHGEVLVGVEALIRWHHPELGNISPTVFIPLAEESELIVEIGEWVLRQACEQYRTWQKQGLPHFLLGVNLSLQQMHDPDFLPKVQRILQETQMPPQQLELEVTEGLIFHDLQHTLGILKDLRQNGIGVAIDDFGTGYSSLAVLKNLPINTLKIDKSFLHDLETPPEAAVILESVINLGQRLQLTVVAEGVETESQMLLLQSLQCNVLQGFFFSRPLNTGHITHYLHKSFNSAGSTKAIAA